MRQLGVVAVLCFALSLLGCDSDSQTDAERAATIAKAIQKSPEKTEAILEEHDMTIVEFERLMYQVASTPKLAKDYREKAAMGD
jgi:ABC-type Fe3+-citrate transport system substrate-binding protein